MHTDPKVVFHKEQPYVAIVKTVAMMNIPKELPPLIFKVKTWLSNNNENPAGPPFFLYQSCYNNGNFKVAVGFPVPKKLEGDDLVQGGTIPAGRYATTTHLGDYKNLNETHMFLQSWIDNSNELTENRKESKDGVELGSRIESYVTDPNGLPPAEWKTEVSFLLEDA